MLTRRQTGSLTLFIDGVPIAAEPGDLVATALLAAGVVATRTSPVSDEPRGPYCMMGACFECLAVVDGVPDVQTCLTPVRDGMRILRQRGARHLPAAEDSTA
jgi:hypothetical protein